MSRRRRSQELDGAEVGFKLVLMLVLLLALLIGGLGGFAQVFTSLLSLRPSAADVLDRLGAATS